MSARDATFTIRDAADDDLATITTIYEHHVRNGLGSFEEEPVVPSTLHGHPAADTPLPRTDTVHPHGGKRGDERGDMVERDRLATRQSRRPHPASDNQKRPARAPGIGTPRPWSRPGW